MAAVHTARPLAPAAYAGTITDARVISLDFRASPENPDGLTLRVAVEISDDNGAATVFDAVSVTNERRLLEVCRAAGVTFQRDGAAIADDLVGRRVRRGSMVRATTAGAQTPR